MQPSPLQLLQHSFEVVHIDAVNDFDNTDRDTSFVVSPVGMNLSSETGVQELHSEQSWSDYGLQFRLNFAPKTERAVPYRGQLTVHGVVRMHGQDDVLERKKIAVVNGVSLLYGIIRDMVCAVTSRGVHGQMLLPTLNFKSLADSVANDEGVAQDSGNAKRSRSGTKDGAFTPGEAKTKDSKPKRQRVAKTARN